MATLVTGFYESPIGILEIAGSAAGIRAVRFRDDLTACCPDPPPLLVDCIAQLDAYFNGTRTEFDLPLELQGTDFQRRVWRELIEIPFGSTRTYAEIAAALGDPKTVRAVGVANGRNPVAIIVPCHRVVGSDGSLIGYAGGLWRKEWLLAHEGFPIQQTLF